MAQEIINSNPPAVPWHEKPFHFRDFHYAQHIRIFSGYPLHAQRQRENAAEGNGLHAKEARSHPADS